MAGFDFKSMTDAERAAHDHIAAGDVADFQGTETKPRIRAALLRALALRAPAPVCGIRVRHAHIEGDLDLSCVSLPAVIIEDCDIPGRIGLANARLGALSLDRSRFFQLSFQGASIDGPFDFSHATPFAEQAWIDASRAYIRGGVTARGAKLRTPPKRAKEAVGARGHIYALRLSETEIRGNLWLSDHFTAEGGVCLDETYVRGTCSIVENSVLTSSEDDTRHPGDCLHAYSLRCDGMMALNFGISTQGRIFILNSVFGSRFNIDGALNGTRPGYDFKGRTMNTNAAIMVESSEVGGNFNITNSAIDCGVSLSDSTIGNNVWFARTKITNRAADGSGQGLALAIERAKIGRDLILGPGFSAEGKVSLARTSVGGDLDLSGAKIDNMTPDNNGFALDARRMRIGGEVRPENVRAEQIEGLAGRVDFGGTTTG